MEKITKIKAKDLYIEQGVWCDVECCLCAQDDRIVAANEKELVKRLKELGWQNINSDKHMMKGHWCGSCNIS